jgi:CHAT domain
VGELLAALRGLPAGDPYAPLLKLELGLAYGYPAFCDPAQGNRRQATKYLTEAVQQLGPADPQCGVALFLLVFFLLQADHDTAVTDLIVGMADEALRGGGLDRDLAALLQLVSSMVRTEQLRRGGSAPAGIDEVIRAQLSRAKALGSEDHAPQAVVLASVGGLLSSRFTQTHALDDHDAAAVYHRHLFELFGEHGQPSAVPRQPGAAQEFVLAVDPAVQRAGRASNRLSTAIFDRDLAAVDDALAELGAARAELPPDHQLRPVASLSLGEGWRWRGLLSGDRTDVIRGLRLLASADEQGGGGLLDHVWYRRVLRECALPARAELGLLTGNPDAISAAIRDMSALDGDPAMTPAEQAAWSWRYGMALIGRHDLTGDRRDLSDGIVKLEDATRAQGPAETAPQYALWQNLAAAYRTRGDVRLGDPQRAIDTALLALRQRAAEVLLQSGAARGLTIAGWRESEQVAQLTAWCLTDGRTDQAVAALELGRAVVLYTATIAADVPDLLRAAGHDDLAGQWRDEVTENGAVIAPMAAWLSASGAGPAPAVPAGIRGKALGALRGVSAWEGLLEPPDIAELAATLRRVRGDAFVYLLPPHGTQPGCAVLVRADGMLHQLPLPGLAVGRMAEYETAFQTAADAHWAGPARQTWHRALTELCDWAWEAVIGPVLRYAAQSRLGRPPRLTLIPTGRLGIVPWHAARHTDVGGEPRYAVQDAVFAYAASARQLAVAAARQQRPWSELPVLVSNPTGDLTMAEHEGQELLRRYYPRAVYLGRPEQIASGAGTPDDVLSRLPGGAAPQASLLHFGCHATVAGSLAASHLVLAGERRLPIAEIVSQAQAHDAAAPGFLAILGACMSDLADVDHDEALTLASAFLAAGASGVIGARWPTGDRVTALLMLMFHHFLSEADAHPAAAHPADALRAAQLWMLDRSRQALAELPAPLASAAHRPGLSEIHAWAAFTYQGV